MTVQNFSDSCRDGARAQTLHAQPISRRSNIHTLADLQRLDAHTSASSELCDADGQIIAELTQKVDLALELVDKRESQRKLDQLLLENLRASNKEFELKMASALETSRGAIDLSQTLTQAASLPGGQVWSISSALLWPLGFIISLIKKGLGIGSR